MPREVAACRKYICLATECWHPPIGLSITSNVEGLTIVSALARRRLSNG